MHMSLGLETAMVSAVMYMFTVFQNSYGIFLSL